MMRYFYLCFFACILFVTSCNSTKQESLLQTTKTKALDLEAPISSISFGSCDKEWLDQSFWETIKKEQSDLWIWLGDIIYADTEDMTKMKQKYDLLKNNDYYAAFRSTTPMIGIWDDHDYGLNDGGSNYIKRKESKALLLDFLDVNKSNQVYQHEGAYQSYTIGPSGKQVKIILLDARYFRDDLERNSQGEERYKINENGAILGEDQWIWLENELKNSTANFNIIASGIQILHTEQYFEKWANFPKERERLLELLDHDSIHNVMLLTGDRHISELAKMDLSSGKTVYEITSSGLTHSYEKSKETNQYRIGPIVRTKSYGVLKCLWHKDTTEVNLSFLNMDGTINFNYSWKYPVLNHFIN